LDTPSYDFDNDRKSLNRLPYDRKIQPYMMTRGGQAFSHLVILKVSTCFSTVTTSNSAVSLMDVVSTKIIKEHEV